jgi:hypothetical protein
MKYFILQIFILLCLMLPGAADARRRTGRADAAAKTVTATPDSSGSAVRQLYVKRTPEQIFAALHAVLRQMAVDMDEFNFAKIHPHLKIVYALYNDLRLLSLGDPDSMVNRGRNLPQRLPGQAPSLARVANTGGGADTSLRIVVEPRGRGSQAISPLTHLVNVQNREGLNPAAVAAAGATQPSPFTLSWSDTSFSTYLLRFEVVRDSLGGDVWNIVFEKVDKIKNKTVKVHQYFDAGEFAISAQDLVWLQDEVNKSETDIMNYFRYQAARDTAACQPGSK